MKTASFFSYAGPGRVSIARWSPRKCCGVPGYAPLMPGSWFRSVSKDEYRKRYFAEILAPLDPRRVVDELEELAAGAEPVLLCWERPPLTETNWCHRRLVAEWLGDRLGVLVDELEPAAKMVRGASARGASARGASARGASARVTGDAPAAVDETPFMAWLATQARSHL